MQQLNTLEQQIDFIEQTAYADPNLLSANSASALVERIEQTDSIKNFLNFLPEESDAATAFELYRQENPDFEDRHFFESTFRAHSYEKQFESAKENLRDSLREHLSVANYLNEDSKQQWLDHFNSKISAATDPLTLRETYQELAHFLTSEDTNSPYTSRPLSYYRQLYEQFHELAERGKNEDPVIASQVDKLQQQFEKEGGTGRKSILQQLKELLKGRGMEMKENVDLEFRKKRVDQVVEIFNSEQILCSSTKRKWELFLRETYLNDQVSDEDFEAAVAKMLDPKPIYDPENRNLAFYREQYSKFMDLVQNFQHENPDYPLEKITKLKDKFTSAGGSKREQLILDFEQTKRNFLAEKELQAENIEKEIKQTLEQIYAQIDKSPFLAEVTKKRSRDYYQNKYANAEGKEGLAAVKNALKKLNSPEKGEQTARNLKTYELQYNEFHSFAEKYSKENPHLTEKISSLTEDFDNRGMHFRTQALKDLHQLVSKDKKEKLKEEKSLKEIKKTTLNRVNIDLNQAYYLSKKTKQNYRDFFQKNFEKPDFTAEQVRMYYKEFSKSVPNAETKNLAAYKYRYDYFMSEVEKKIKSAELDEDKQELEDLKNQYQEASWTGREPLYDQMRDFEFSEKEEESEVKSQKVEEEEPDVDLEDEESEVKSQKAEEAEENEESRMQNAELADEAEVVLEEAEENEEFRMQNAELEEEPEVDLEDEESEVRSQKAEEAEENAEFKMQNAELEDEEEPQEPDFIDAYSRLVNIKQLKERLKGAVEISEKRIQQLVALPSVQNLLADLNENRSDRLVPYLYSFIGKLNKDQFEKTISHFTKKNFKPFETLQYFMEDENFKSYHNETASIFPEAWLLFRDKINSMGYNDYIESLQEVEEPEEIEEPEIPVEKELEEESEVKSQKSEEPQPDVELEDEESAEFRMQNAELEDDEQLDEPDQLEDLFEIQQEEPEDLDLEAEDMPLDELEADTNFLPPEFEEANQPDIIDQLEPLDEKQPDIEEELENADLPEELEDEIVNIALAEVDKPLSDQLLEALFTGELNTLPIPILQKLIEQAAAAENIRKTVKKLDQTKNLKLEKSDLSLFLMFRFLFKISRTTDVDTFLRSFTEFASTYLELKLEYILDSDGIHATLCVRKPMQLFKQLIEHAMNSSNLNSATSCHFQITELGKYLEVFRCQITFDFRAGERSDIFQTEHILVTTDFAKTV